MRFFLLLRKKKLVNADAAVARLIFTNHTKVPAQVWSHILSRWNLFCFCGSGSFAFVRFNLLMSSRHLTLVGCKFLIMQIRRRRHLETVNDLKLLFLQHCRLTLSPSRIISFSFFFFFSSPEITHRLRGRKKKLLCDNFLVVGVTLLSLINIMVRSVSQPSNALP